MAGNPGRLGFGYLTYINREHCSMRFVFDAGVDGIMPHHARQLSDAASSMCACLKTLLQSHQPQADDQPPPKRAKHPVNDETPQENDPASEQGQLLQRHHQQQPQQQQECALQQLQPVDHMQQRQQQQQQQQQQLQQQQQCLQEQIQDQLPTMSSHKGTSLTQLPSHSQPTLAEGLPQIAQPPANQEAALEGVQEVTPEGIQDAALEGAQEAAQAVEDVWQLLISIGTGSQQELHCLLAQQCREEDMQAPLDFRLADDLQLATLGATADFNAAGVCPSGRDAAQS